MKKTGGQKSRDTLPLKHFRSDHLFFNTAKPIIIRLTSAFLQLCGADLPVLFYNCAEPTYRYFSTTVRSRLTGTFLQLCGADLPDRMFTINFQKRKKATLRTSFLHYDTFAKYKIQKYKTNKIVFY